MAAVNIVGIAEDAAATADDLRKQATQHRRQALTCPAEKRTQHIEAARELEHEADCCVASAIGQIKRCISSVAAQIHLVAESSVEALRARGVAEVDGLLAIRDSMAALTNRGQR